MNDMVPDERETGEMQAGEAQIVSGEALSQIVRGEIDIQIATAKKYPRSVTSFLKRASDMATVNQETAAGMFYTLRREGKELRGPSVRLAEVAMSCWGNLRTQSRIIGDDGKFVTAEGVCMDLENNNAVSTTVMRRVTKRDGKRYSDDMIAVTANAAGSIALRNAVFKVIPRVYIDAMWKKARQAAMGDIKTLAERKQAALEWFHKAGISIERVCASVGKAGSADISGDDLVDLLGTRNAIEDGAQTLDEAFPVLPSDAKSAHAKLSAPMPPGNGSKRGVAQVMSPTSTPETRTAVDAERAAIAEAAGAEPLPEPPTTADRPPEPPKAENPVVFISKGQQSQLLALAKKHGITAAELREATGHDIDRLPASELIRTRDWINMRGEQLAVES